MSVRHLNRRNLPIEDDLYRLAGSRIDMDLPRLAVEIAGRNRKILALPLVHVHLHDVAIGAVKGRVDVQHSLDVVVACGQVGEALDGITDGPAADDGPLAGLA